MEPVDTEHAPLIAWLIARGADRCAHPGGTLLAHSLRTAHTLAAWGASRALTAAGLCHAAYGTQGYPTALVPLANRSTLRELIGDDAEAIVYAYAACDRTYDRARAGEMRDRFSGEYWTPPQQLQRQLAELTVSNELDVVEHAQLGGDALAGIQSIVTALAPHLSQASWSAVQSSTRVRDGLSHALPPVGDRDLAYRELGSVGPHVLLWHGGGAPEMTWARQHPLSTAFQLRIPWRRGFAPSVAVDRQDWAADARDLLRVMSDRPHVIAHSYGGVSAACAASVAPERFASLTLIEAPLWAFAPNDAEIQQLAALGRAFANGAPESRAAFLALAALPVDHASTLQTERLARNFRDPGEATPQLGRVRSAGVPTAIVSGGHNAAIERLCDALSVELGAQRWVLGSGHAVQRQPEFNVCWREFVEAQL
jgi:pimeloyl-ACP methyl ester carboxylesterase